MLQPLLRLDLAQATGWRRILELNVLSPRGIRVLEYLFAKEVWWVQ